MSGIRTLGNDLHTGARSFDFVGRAKIWFTIAILAILACCIAPLVRGGLELGIEFTGGSEYTVSAPTTADQGPAASVVAQHTSTPARVSTLGDGAVRVQTDAFDQATTNTVRDELAAAYGVAPENVAVSTIGPSWGADITRQMLIGLAVFLVLAATLMALYFRTWKISLAAILALFHDLILTVGIYAITGFEVTPATVIGFLTILGYSLYDTVVVFDRVREQTATHSPEGTRTFGELVNLAINQTLVRSINTSVVALLPVAAILFIGAFIMGAGTLRDISLALFIGILVGAVSTIFMAAPLYAWLRSREPAIRRIDRKIRLRRGESEADAIAATGGKDIDLTETKAEAEARRRRRTDDEVAPIVPGKASAAEDEDPWELREAEDAESDADVDAEPVEDEPVEDATDAEVDTEAVESDDDAEAHDETETTAARTLSTPKAQRPKGQSRPAGATSSKRRKRRR
ncbi:Protein translocase subunit SecF [Pseudoclavibacter triregionum]|nr:Protein translocase subunit SecF [Pseudoclavibacter triregionum]